MSYKITIYFLFLSLFGGLASCSYDSGPSDRIEILAIMDQQEACWNEGDIKCFMEGYWPSDSLMFISKEEITYGYQNTLERYINNYPDRSAMGMLNFNVIELQRLADDAYFMVGEWQLRREIGDIGGHFTLLFRKIDGAWYIVRDHSS